MKKDIPPKKGKKEKKKSRKREEKTRGKQEKRGNGMILKLPAILDYSMIP